MKGGKTIKTSEKNDDETNEIWNNTRRRRIEVPLLKSQPVLRAEKIKIYKILIRAVRTLQQDVGHCIKILLNGWLLWKEKF